MQQKFPFLVSAIVITLILAFILRDYIGLLLIILFYLGMTIAPVIVLLGFVAVLGYFAYTYLVKSGYLSSKISKTTANVRTKELSEDLALVFKRNDMRKVQHILIHLPAWPITQQIQQTAQTLAELKRSVYRAQSEGVPASMIERYLQNMNQAATTIWQLASKVDAVGLQTVSYQLVSPRLHQEEVKLQQLQDAMKASHEGIALLILAGTTSNLLQEVDDDLRALTAAIKSLEAAQIPPNLV